MKCSCCEKEYEKLLYKNKCNNCYMAEYRKTYPKETSKKYRVKNQDRIKETSKKYRAKNQDRIKEAKKKYRQAHLESTRDSQRKWEKANPDKVRAAGKKYRAKNQDRIKEAGQKYRQAHLESIRERKRKWSKANPDKVRASKKKYNSLHSEKAKERHKKWVKANPDRVTHNHRKRRALKKGIMENYTLEDKKYTLGLFGYRCFKCGDIDNLCIDHHYPLIDGNPLTRKNAVVLCNSCNCSKNKRQPEDFYNEAELDELKHILGLKGE